MKRLDEIKLRIANAKDAAEQSYKAAQREFNRPHRERWTRHYASQGDLARDVEFLLTEAEFLLRERHGS